jgi:hypothetical protein
MHYDLKGKTDPLAALLLRHFVNAGPGAYGTSLALSLNSDWVVIDAYHPGSCAGITMETQRLASQMHLGKSGSRF